MKRDTIYSAPLSSFASEGSFLQPDCLRLSVSISHAELSSLTTLGKESQVAKVPEEEALAQKN